MNIQQIFTRLGLSEEDLNGGSLTVHSPRDGQKIAAVAMDSPDSAADKIAASVTAFKDQRPELFPRPAAGQDIKFGAEGQG